MKAFGVLVRLNLRLMIAGMHDGIRKKNGKLDIGKIILYVIAAVGVVALIGFVIFLELSLFDVFKALGMPEKLPELATMLAMLASLFFSIYQMLATMYFSREPAAMAYLPIKSWAVLAAKWAEVYVSEIPFSLLIATPAFVLYGLNCAQGWTYWLRMVPVLLCIDCIPLIISLLLSSVVARFTSVTRNKEMWAVIGTVIMLGVVLWLEWGIMPKFTDDADATQMMQLLINLQPTMEKIVGAFPPVTWAVSGVGGNWLLWLLFIAASVGVTVAVIALLGRSYLNVALRQSESSRKTKNVQMTDGTFRRKSAFMAIFCREWKEIFRVPIYTLNGVLGVLMLPIILLGGSIGAAKEGGANFIGMLLELFQNELQASDVMLVLGGMLAIVSWLNPLVSTAVSREGRRLPIAKCIPVSARTQLLAKLSVNLALNAAAILIMGIAMLILLGWQYWWAVLGAMIIGNLFSIANGCAAITIDACRPTLRWKSEQAVMKQNMNEMIAMLASTIIIILPIAACIGVIILINNTAVMRFAVTIAVLLLETAAAALVFMHVGAKRYAELEP